MAKRKAKKDATEQLQESMRETAAIIGGPLDEVINGKPKSTNRDGGPSNDELISQEAFALGVPEGATPDETADRIADFHFDKHFATLKMQSPDSLLCFRFGDSYEFLHDDAREAAAVLGIVVTDRDKGPNPAPVAAFMHDKLAEYLRKLLEAGKKVAVCEPVADSEGQPIERVVVEPTTEPVVELIAEPDATSTTVVDDSDADDDDEPDDDAYFHSLTDLEAECEAFESRWANAKERAKDAKKLYESAVLKLRKAVRDGNKPMPLFDSANGKPQNVEPPKPTIIPTGADAAADPNAWRNCSIDELGFTPTLTEKLNENGIETIGQLEDKRAAWGGLKQIKGIGQKKIDLIEEAVINWLSKNRDAMALAAASTPSHNPVVEPASTVVPPVVDVANEAQPAANEATNETETTNEVTTIIVTNNREVIEQLTEAPYPRFVPNQESDLDHDHVADAPIVDDATAGSFDDI